jgi:MoxR-like ATPase
MAKLDKQQILNDLRESYGTTISREQVLAYEQSKGLNPRSVVSFVRVLCPRVGRGLYGLVEGAVAPEVSPTVPKAPKAPRVSAPKVSAPRISTYRAVSSPVEVTVTAQSDAPTAFALTAQTSRADLIASVKAFAAAADSLSPIPSVSDAFVPFGDFAVVRAIVRSRSFHPIFITGDSGNGKTFQVEQACAAESREYLRVNITEETDEDDLIGGFRLKNGETVFELGPVSIAMLRGSVLLLDEVDLAGPKVMCLQPVLEGRPLTIKKLGITIHPSSGFTIVATANTKGRGNETGRFVGTNLLNEAFLERFPITLEQQYPGITVEKKILAKTYQSLTGQSPTAAQLTFFETLAKWADAIRTTYLEGGIDDLISTRRLVHIVKTSTIVESPLTAMTLCLNRFDTETKSKLLDFWSKLTPETTAAVPVAEAVPEAAVEPEVAPF